jgi:hypothetical protein
MAAPRRQPLALCIYVSLFLYSSLICIILIIVLDIFISPIGIPLSLFFAFLPGEYCSVDWAGVVWCVCYLCVGWLSGCWVVVCVLGGRLGVGWLSVCCLVVCVLGGCLGVVWLSGCWVAV